MAAKIRADAGAVVGNPHHTSLKNRALIFWRFTQCPWHGETVTWHGSVMRQGLVTQHNVCQVCQLALKVPDSWTRHFWHDRLHVECTGHPNILKYLSSLNILSFNQFVQSKYFGIFIACHTIYTFQSASSTSSIPKYTIDEMWILQIFAGVNLVNSLVGGAWSIHNSNPHQNL